MLKITTALIGILFVSTTLAESIYFSGEREFSESSFFNKTEVIYTQEEDKVIVCGIHTGIGQFFLDYEFEIREDKALFHNGVRVGKLRRNGFFAEFIHAESGVQYDLSLSWTEKFKSDEKKFLLNHDVITFDLLTYTGRNVTELSQEVLEYCKSSY